MTDAVAPPPPPPPPIPPRDGADESTPVDSTASRALRIGLMLLAIALLVRSTGWWGLAIVAGLVLMIFLHELGHFIMAKRAGMKVTEFFLGFGPRLWSFRRGETEYGIKLIPAGAYVKIIGMSMAEDSDDTAEEHTYRAQPFWQRFGVAVAGSTMHFIQALVLIFVVLVFIGAPGGKLAGAEPVSNVTQVGDVYAGCPAAAAGIRPDDEIVAVNGQRLRHYTELGTLIAPLANKDADFLIRRKGVTKHVTVHIVPRYDDPGAPGMLGLSYGAKLPESEKVGPLRAVPRTVVTFGSMMKSTIPAFFKAFSPSNLHSFGKQVVDARQDRRAVEKSEAHPTPTVLADGHAPAQSNERVTTQTCIASMGGEAAFKSKRSEASAQDGRFMSIVGIFNIGKGMASSGGIGDLLLLFVVVNIFIGVFNLIPLLPFDGGHVAIALYEKIREWRSRSGQRYYTDMNKLAPVVYVVVLLLGLLFVSTLYIDIANPLTVK